MFYGPTRQFCRINSLKRILIYLKKTSSVVKSWTETLFFIDIHDLHNCNQSTISNFVCDKRYMITLKLCLCLYLFLICHILRNSLVQAQIKFKDTWKKPQGLSRIRFPCKSKDRLNECHNMDEQTLNAQLLRLISSECRESKESREKSIFIFIFIFKSSMWGHFVFCVPDLKFHCMTE